MSCRGCRDGTRGKCGWAMGGRVESTVDSSGCPLWGSRQGYPKEERSQGSQPKLTSLLHLTRSLTLTLFLQVEARSLEKMSPKLESTGPWNDLGTFLDAGDPVVEQRRGTDSPESQGLTAPALPLTCCVTWCSSLPTSGPPFPPPPEEWAGLVALFSSCSPWASRGPSPRLSFPRVVEN